MIFKSKTDRLHQILIGGTVIFLLLVIALAWLNNSGTTSLNLWLTILLLAISGFLYWIYNETYYRISDTLLSYHAGPISGKIDILSIREMQVNKTLWIGTLKPATALNGIIIHYNQLDTIYISPTDKENFVKNCLAINPNIKIQNF